MLFFTASHKQPRKQTTVGRMTNRISTWSCAIRGQDDLPLFLLILLSSHWPETQLLPDLHVVLCVFGEGTSVYCTKHDISQHWLDMALGDTQQRLLALFCGGVCFFGFTLVQFIRLNALWLSFCVYTPFFFFYFLSFSFLSLPFPAFTFPPLFLNLGLKFVS